mmetsp:Transcript_20358/g.49197  ORF Transcript_20358/g.49197 Transcript_20358/m.49197 type:complete len:411 (-) Transcript_20358:428-1660(-)
MILEGLEVLFRKLDKLEVRVLVLREDKLEVDPRPANLLERLLHLLFLLGPVDNLADVVFERMELEIEEVFELELFVDDKFHAGEVHEHRPVAIPHRWVPQVRDERDRGQEVLELLLRDRVRVRPLDKLFRRAKLLEVHLGAVVHVLAVDVVPQRLVPLVELEGNHVLVVPHLQHLLELLVAPVLDRLAGLHQLRELENACVSPEFLQFMVRLEELFATLDDVLVRRVDPCHIVEERLLAEFERVHLAGVLVGVDVVLDLEGLPLLHTQPQLPRHRHLLLDGAPRVDDFVHLRVGLVHVDAMLLEQHDRVAQHVLLEFDLRLLLLEVVDARVHLEEKVALLDFGVSLVRVDREVPERRTVELLHPVQLLCHARGHLGHERRLLRDLPEIEDAHVVVGRAGRRDGEETLLHE